MWRLEKWLSVGKCIDKAHHSNRLLLKLLHWGNVNIILPFLPWSKGQLV